LLEINTETLNYTLLAFVPPILEWAVSSRATLPRLACSSRGPVDRSALPRSPVAQG